jgi:hypothetical protein
MKTRHPAMLISALVLIGAGIVIAVVGIVLLGRDDGSGSETPTATATAEPVIEQVTPPPAQTLPAEQMVVYLVAPEGGPGPVGPIGCGEYLVSVTRGDVPPAPLDQQIAAALTDLFSIKDQFYGQSGLYTALYQSNLTVERIELDAAGHANIYLTGTYLLAGECSDPVFRAQIEYTAQQFPGVSGVSVWINFCRGEVIRAAPETRQTPRRR